MAGKQLQIILGTNIGLFPDIHVRRALSSLIKPAVFFSIMKEQIKYFYFQELNFSFKNQKYVMMQNIINKSIKIILNTEYRFIWVNDEILIDIG